MERLFAWIVKKKGNRKEEFPHLKMKMKMQKNEKIRSPLSENEKKDITSY